MAPGRTSEATDALRTGVRSLLRDYAAIKQGDYALVAYTPDAREYAAHLVAGLRGDAVAHRTLAMTPLVDDTLEERLAKVKPAPAGFTGNLVVFTLERDTMSHFEVFAPLFTEYGQARTKIMRVISATGDFFAHALRLPPEELAARNAALLDFLAPVRTLRVRTDAGTDVTIELAGETFEWISNRGKWRPGGFTILPAGEIATFPARVDGTLVADGALNANIVTRRDMRLAAAPVRVEIRDSRAVSHATSDGELGAFLAECFAMDNAERVGELGFGTNSGIPEFVALNSHLNERRPGLHLGFGQHNQSRDRVGYEARLHLDMVTDDATLTDTDSGRSMRLSELLPRYDIPHPQLVRDEDVTGDCCSTGCRPVALNAPAL